MLSKVLKFLLFTFLITFPVITSHEIGHLVSGKFFNLNPNNFSIGFGPEVFFIENFWDLRWSIRTIPLGGYVSFPDGSILNSTANNTTPWIITLLAGPFFNFIMAFFMFLLFIKNINSKIKLYYIENENNSFFALDLSYFNFASNIYLLNNEDHNLIEMSHLPEDMFLKELSIDPIKFSLSLSFPLFFKISKEYILLIKAFKSSYGENRRFLGPYAIVRKGISEYDKSKYSFLFYIGELSVGIGFLNLIPLPMLDGGKIWFLLSQTIGSFSLFFLFLILFLIISSK